MGDEDTWRKVLDIIRRYDQPVVVVSATARTTRKLLAAAEQALNDLDGAQQAAQQIKNRHEKIVHNFISHFPDADGQALDNCQSWINQHIDQLNSNLEHIAESQELTAATKDAVAATGERLSSYLFARCGSVAGHQMRWIDAADIIRTDDSFGQANPDIDFINKQRPQLMEHHVSGDTLIMGGYYGQDQNGHTTTLGFEGSDYTASLLGAALSAEAIEIWTDVSGIYTCDPRVTEDAQPIPQLSFQEATELAYFGAKVLHPSTTKPASQQQIPVWVKNIFAPDEPGTRISHEVADNGRVKAMTYKEHCVVLTVTSSNTVMGYEFLAGVFDILRWHHLPVDVVTTTEASVSIAIEQNDRISKAAEQLQSFGSVNLQSDQGIISLVGCTKKNTRSLVRDLLDNLNGSSVNMLSFSQSKGNLNIVMDGKLVIPSVKAIHKQLFG